MHKPSNAQLNGYTLRSIMNELLTIDCGNTSRVLHTSKLETEFFLSFTDASHQSPQDDAGYILVVAISVQKYNV